MICPRCNSANVSVHRECSDISNFEDHRRIHKRNSFFIPADFNQSKTYVNYKTVAVCNNCGNTWTVGATGSALVSLLFAFILFALSIGGFYFYFHKILNWGASREETTQTTTTNENSDPTVITTDKVIDTEIWATEYTSIEDFEWDVDENGIVLGKYKNSGNRDAKIRLSDHYTINGEEYHIYKIDASFTLKTVKSVIIPEGVTEIVNHSFNSCGIEYLYLPSTLEEFTGWNYFHDLKTLYYGGSEEDFNSKFDTVDRLKDVTIIYDANPEELN